MEKEPRKATDVILELESKIDIALNLIRNQDLNIKLLSNKLNLLLEKSNSESNKIIVEAVNTIPQSNIEKTIPVSSENKLPLEQNPKGFRRTSRPETFTGDDAYLNKPDNKSTVTFPMQMPKNMATAEIVVPDQVKPTSLNKEKAQVEAPSNAIPVVQRVVDKNGKSVFLADIEIINAANNEPISKTRTNGTGKWMASLPVGQYKVIAKKRESLTKEKVEVVQTIMVDGGSSPLELPMMIMKI
jgi:hypothetical protein